MKRAIIVGSKGQDGRLLYERLINISRPVLGIGRGEVQSSEPFDLLEVDIFERQNVLDAVKIWQPDEIYYLPAFHHSSQDTLSSEPLELFEKSHAVHVKGLLNFLEAIRLTSFSTKLFYAASSLVFGETSDDIQSENTPMNPRCIYGITKVNGVHCCRFYRKTYGIHASVGFLYNHESPYRAEKFVSQKIIRAAVDIFRGINKKLVLGDLSAKIDWGYAPDFVEAMTCILTLKEAGDFVVATGKTHSVKEFVKITFGLLGLDWKKHVEENPSLLKRRNLPSVGDTSKLHQLTGWQPSVSFEKMVEILLQAEITKRISAPASPQSHY